VLLDSAHQLEVEPSAADLVIMQRLLSVGSMQERLEFLGG
jgi:hypothetical protein